MWRIFEHINKNRQRRFMKEILVLLSGSGVYDGSEIHEAVFSLLAIDRRRGKITCAAPDKKQFHVINHISGEPMDESRNVLIEAARIARGNIHDIASIQMKNYDGLVIPGGFGAAKNLNQWAINGPEGEIDPDVKRLINEAVDQGKPIAAMCMGPTVVAKALENTEVRATVTVGSDEADSPYDIKGISDGMESIGAHPVMKTVHQIAVDSENKIITAPCYMMEASITEIHENIEDLIDKFFEFLNEN
jgi:enhancing lycopene biosynthesis protein 2